MTKIQLGLKVNLLAMKSKLSSLPILIISMIIITTAIWLGLLRLGWPWPVLRPTLSKVHGPLMVSGFFGTVIGLERAVALKKQAAFLGPVLTAAGGLAQIIWDQAIIGRILLAIGSISMVIVFIYILKIHFTSYYLVMTAGAFCWLVGNILWLIDFKIYRLVFWWVGFFVFTIAGERLELGRILRLSKTKILAFNIFASVLLSGFVISLFNFSLGTYIVGSGLLGLAFWLFQNDISRRTVRQTGLTRYIALCLLSGYIWLGFAGAFLLVTGNITTTVTYGPFLHSIFLGFVFTMVFGHAPIIFTAILGFPIEYHPKFYIHLTLLHISLFARVYGTISRQMWVRRWGGLFNAIALILFIFSILPLNKLNFQRIRSKT